MVLEVAEGAEVVRMLAVEHRLHREDEEEEGDEVLLSIPRGVLL